jgi:hypothetical protein
VLLRPFVGPRYYLLTSTSVPFTRRLGMPCNYSLVSVLTAFIVGLTMGLSPRCNFSIHSPLIIILPAIYRFHVFAFSINARAFQINHVSTRWLFYCPLICFKSASQFRQIRRLVACSRPTPTSNPHGSETPSPATAGSSP